MFVGDGRAVAEGGMQPRRVGPAFDEAEAGDLRLGLRRKAAAFQQLAFEGREEPVGHGGVHAAAGAADHGLAGHRNNDSHGRRDDLVVAAMIKAAAAAILLAAVWPNMTAAADEPSAGAPAPPPPSADPTKLLLGDYWRAAIRAYQARHNPGRDRDRRVSRQCQRRGSASLIYEGLTDLSLAFDFRPQFHWRGNFFVRAYQIHGKGLTAANIDNLNTISGIEATATTRLFELWYEQHIGDWLRIRIGQQSAGQEFLVTTAAKPFVNSAFGWPTLPDTDLPSGGPSYPLA